MTIIEYPSNVLIVEVPIIKYEGPSSKNPLAYHYYNAEEVVFGKKMKDHLRFAVCNHFFFFFSFPLSFSCLFSRSSLIQNS